MLFLSNLPYIMSTVTVLCCVALAMSMEIQFAYFDRAKHLVLIICTFNLVKA